jgi:hypothetical protein
MSKVLERLLDLQKQINTLVDEMKGAPKAPKKVKRVKVVPMEDKDAAKEAGKDAANAIEEAAEKPKKVLSPEHLAKLKAGREVAKARKAAEEAAEVAKAKKAAEKEAEKVAKAQETKAE